MSVDSDNIKSELSSDIYSWLYGMGDVYRSLRDPFTDDDIEYWLTHAPFIHDGSIDVDMLLKRVNEDNNLSDVTTNQMEKTGLYRIELSTGLDGIKCYYIYSKGKLDELHYRRSVSLDEGTGLVYTYEGNTESGILTQNPSDDMLLGRSIFESLNGGKLVNSVRSVSLQHSGINTGLYIVKFILEDMTYIISFKIQVGTLSDLHFNILNDDTYPSDVTTRSYSDLNWHLLGSTRYMGYLQKMGLY
jgi:hypothetical protein